MSTNKRSKKAYESLTPSLLVPNHFNCNEETTMVALYDEPIGDKHESIVLYFPGDMAGSTQRQVVPRKVGNQSIVFRTPVYSTSRGQVEVSPILTMRNGDKIQLGKFRLTLKHPLTTVMELSIKLSSSSAVLPVLTTLMLNVDKDGDKTHFMDSHTDRVMTLLVGSMKPGTSGTIKDILLPADKKLWKKRNLTDLARAFELRNMEKEAYMITSQRKQTAKTLKRSETVCKYEDAIAKDKSRETSPFSDDTIEQAEGGGVTTSFSSPSINTLGLGDDDESEVGSRVFMTSRLMNNKERVRVVTQDFHSREPGKLSLRAGQRVYVITCKSSQVGWWYGASDGRHGTFPSWCVEPAPNERPREMRIPFPPLPKREPLSFDDRCTSPPALSPRRGVSLAHIPQGRQCRQKVTYRKTEGRSSIEDRAKSQDFATYTLNDSGDYVDMVAQQQRVYPSDSDSESLCDTEEPETTDTSSNQGYLPILSHYKHQATAVSHEEQDNASPPIPPLRTASMRVGATRVQFQGDENKSDSDDDQDYVNMRRQGLPLASLALRYKANEMSSTPQDSEGQGHRDIDSPTVQEGADLGTSPKPKHEMVSDTIFRIDHEEFESRRQARMLRHTGRVTHESVVKNKPSAQVPPIPLPRQMNVPSRAEEKPTAAPRSHRT